MGPLGPDVVREGFLQAEGFERVVGSDVGRVNALMIIPWANDEEKLETEETIVTLMMSADPEHDDWLKLLKMSSFTYQ